jgi:hypothetical protein
MTLGRFMAAPIRRSPGTPESRSRTDSGTNALGEQMADSGGSATPNSNSELRRRCKGAAASLNLLPSA